MERIKDITSIQQQENQNIKQEEEVEEFGDQEEQ